MRTASLPHHQDQIHYRYCGWSLNQTGTQYLYTKKLLCGTNRDSGWWSTCSRWHIIQLITIFRLSLSLSYHLLSLGFRHWKGIFSSLLSTFIGLATCQSPAVYFAEATEWTQLLLDDCKNMKRKSIWDYVGGVGTPYVAKMPLSIPVESVA